MVSFGSQSVLEVNDRMAEVGRGLVQSSLGLLAVMQPRALAATLAVRTSLVATRSQGFPFGKSQGFPHCLWLDLTLEHTQCSAVYRKLEQPLYTGTEEREGSGNK